MIWSELANKTNVTREKEDAHDYRYFPEPDLAPLHISTSYIEDIISQMPELPDELALRLKEQYNLNDAGVTFLISDKNIASYYEQVVQEINNPNLVLNWIRTNVMSVTNRDKIDIDEFSVRPSRLAELLKLLDNQKITKQGADQIFKTMTLNSQSALEIMKELKLEVSINQDDLSGIINQIIKSFPEELDRLQKGEEKLIKFFMGQVMKESKGKYSPQLIIQELNKIINDR